MRSRNEVLSWGRCHRFNHTRLAPSSIDRARDVIGNGGPVLPFGRGRSYGDSCLNENGTLIDTRRLDRFISFNEQNGELVCEAGVTLASILALLERRPRQDDGYWFLPVVPGTKFVTVGGAIANDVHGKNHEVQGTFGRHLNWFELARSDGQVLRCSPQENAGLFCATIAGLGLTGLITRASLRLMRVPSLMLEVEHVRLRDLDHYFTVARESCREWTYHAAWVDALAGRASAGRGIYTRSRFTADASASAATAKSGDNPRIPIDVPKWLVGHASIKLFNSVYSRKLIMTSKRVKRSYGPIFFPLDGIRDWNRIYGKHGFYQYQCVVPRDQAGPAMRAMLDTIRTDGQGSFLSVLKEFGDLESPGLLSFPMPGTTLAVDFPNHGERTLRLLDRLDAITAEAGGRIYMAKDGRAPPRMLTSGYLGLDRFRQSIDPAFSSTLWRRSTVSH